PRASGPRDPRDQVPSLHQCIGSSILFVRLMTDIPSGGHAMEETLLVPDEAIAAQIHWIRGEKVMLDEDLAALYQVPTKRLNEQVRRNMDRFPEDFMFVLDEREWDPLRSQFATSKKGRGGRRYPPMAFTEHGVLMLSSVLNSERAIAVNIRIMRIFVRMNRILMNDRELLLRLERMEDRQDTSDEALARLFEAVRQLMEKPAWDRKRLGFKGGDEV
ncbi:MAG: ORF6N domain-containing protein, partial [Flavobacteriales bacterium]|nr:ORF6N domain-containing protein [Flavobacteriales bacterium]